MPKLKLPRPRPLPYDALKLSRASWAQKVKSASRAWAIQGYGAPKTVYIFYVVKVFLFLLGALFFCSIADGWVTTRALHDNLLDLESFKRVLLYSMMFELLGLGCGSGPLTARYVPPIAACLHFGRPGTVKLPFLKRLPWFRRTTRGWIEASLYWCLIGISLFNLFGPKIDHIHLSWTLGLLVCLSLSDKTIFLAARGEHYAVMLFCLLFPQTGLLGPICVQMGLWLWAAVSKLTPNFPSVVAAMLSNSPVMPSGPFKRRLYRNFPEDLRPSRLTHIMAHFGTVLEFTFPLLLLFGDGANVTLVGLTMMVVFHAYITSHCPVAVPLEWNFVMVFGGVFLFRDGMPAIAPLLHTPTVSIVLIVCVVVVPLIGHLAPHRISFLLAMRYYAGNWPYSVWLCKDGVLDRISQAFSTAGGHPKKQLARLYDQEVVESSMQLVSAFRSVHLQGRVLHDALPLAYRGVEEQTLEHHDGEVIAGWLLGWNFGDGHLHNEQLVDIVQAHCHFEPGDLRCIFVEGQPLLRHIFHWRVYDAAAGLQQWCVGLQPCPTTALAVHHSAIRG